MILKSTIHCPFCGFEKEEEMPTDACRFFYQCTNCQKILKPKEGECCVFCSYGDVACPPVKEALLSAGATRDDTCCDRPKATIR